MKTTRVAGILGFLILASILHAQEQTTIIRGGRFQLKEVSYTAYNEEEIKVGELHNPVFTRTALLKIDTETGEVWYLDSRILKDKTLKNSFIPIQTYILKTSDEIKEEELGKQNLEKMIEDFKNKKKEE